MAGMKKTVIVREAELAEMLGVARSTIRRNVKAGVLPRPFKIGKRSVGWHCDDIDDWLNRRRAA